MLGVFLATAAVNAAASVGGLAPRADGSYVLVGEHARLLLPDMSQAAVAPRLTSLADDDGFPATRALAPMPAGEGALAWTLEVLKPGRFIATLEFSHSRHGNAFELQIGERVLSGYAPDTGGEMGLLEVGEIDIPGGRQLVTLRNTVTVGKAFMTVGALHLRPVSQRAMMRPQIRASINRQKPRATPTGLFLPEIFGDRMVLQREMPVPVWGRAAPEARVTVGFQRQTKRVKADAEGRWMVRLDPMEAGGPFELVVSDGQTSARFVDVLIGEVWFGSGQSNMEVSVKFPARWAKPEAPYECDEDTKQLIEAGVHPEIRLSAVTRDRSRSPEWSALSLENCLDAPALMVCAAVLLREKLDVPIGIIVRCASSSPSGVWLSRDAVEGDAEIQRQIAAYAADEYPRLVAGFPEELRRWEAAARQARAGGAEEPPKPPKPTPPGRSPVRVFHEGQFEFHGAKYAALIAPVLPFAVRGIVWDQGEAGTGIAGADQNAVMPALVRSWRAAWGRPDLPFLYIRKNQHPDSLPAVMAALSATVQVDNRGLGQINHPPDKAAYARRLVKQMDRFVYRNIATSN